jgi:hypothetical protein
MKEFAPLGVADEGRIEESAPPDFPKALHDKLLKQYKGEEEKAYATMWKIFYAKDKGHKKMNEMWTAWENKSMNEAEEAAPEGEVDHDETDLSNPEEAREVELANKIKALANELLSMHGAEEAAPEAAPEEAGEEGKEEAGEETEK